MPDAAQPPRGHLAVLLAVSASMLAFEILLVRLFEFSHWHHFAGLAVSLALLGLGGAGTWLALFGDRALRRGDDLVLVGAAIQAAGTLLVLVLHSRIAIRPLFAAWDAGELGRLLLVDFAAFIPFFGAGLVIGGTFARWPAASRSIYAANLVGSGAGSLAASVMLAFSNPEKVLPLVALLPSMAFVAMALRRRRVAAIGTAFCVVCLATFIQPPAPKVSDFKALSRIMDLPDARLLSREPGLPGEMRVVRSESLRNAPGLSLQWKDPVPVADAVIVGSDRMVPMPREFPADAAHSQASLGGLPMQLRPSGELLVLGTSAWMSPAAAAGRGLTWVEPDGRLLELARERGLQGPGTHLVADGAYRFLAAGNRRFELISIDAAMAPGDAASEDYLMTVEGLEAALAALTPDGLLALPLELSVPPRHSPRALATLDLALKRRGIDEPGRHVAALRGLQEILFLASPRPLSTQDLDRIRRFAERWRFDLAWLPGLQASETNRYHQLEGPVFHQLASAVFADAGPPSAARWFEDSPAELTRPYFWRSLVWSRIPDFFRALGRDRALSYLDWTLLLTAASAVVAAGLAFMFIIAPLGRLPPAPGRYGRASVASYFTALGLGYLLVELVFFQRAILFLDKPVTAAALVFAIFLIGSGVGSARAPLAADGRAVVRIFAPIAAGLAAATLILWSLADTVIALPLSGRVAVIVLALAPLAWALGRAFPWALRQLAGYGRWVPWAWGINGFASVLAASLATLVSVQWGQPATLGCAAACYAAACVIARRWVMLDA